MTKFIYAAQCLGVLIYLYVLFLLSCICVSFNYEYRVHSLRAQLRQRHFAQWIIPVICRARDVVAGSRMTVVRTYSPFAEYFGKYNETGYDTVQSAHGVIHGRGVMAKSHYGQGSWGSVRLVSK